MVAFLIKTYITESTKVTDLIKWDHIYCSLSV